MLVALPELAFAQLTSKLKSNDLRLLSGSCKTLNTDLRDLMREIRAVATISGFWKWYGPFMSTGQVISRFKAAMLSGEQLRPLEFYTAVLHLRKTSTRRVAGFLFARLIMVCIGLCPATKETFPRERPSTRNMLTAYMSSYFPDHVFEQIGENENAVRHEAKLLLDLVETFVKFYDEHSSFVQFPRENCLKLVPQMQAFERSLYVWWQPDSGRIIAQIKNALVPLVIEERNLPPGTAADDPVRLQLEWQIARLLDKLHKIGGPAAVDDFHDMLVVALAFEADTARQHE
jgi:hypothetical protein